MAIDTMIHSKSPIENHFWASPNKCVWKGPDFLTTHHVLAEDDDYKSNVKCRRLFTSILEIQDADWSHTLTQISSEKKAIKMEDHAYAKAHISHMYHALCSDVNESSDWDVIR